MWEKIGGLCIMVLACRICDVSLATYRTVITVKGRTKTAAIVAFFETFLWFMVVREALNFEASETLEKIIIALAYAIGYAIRNSSTEVQLLKQFQA